MRTTLDIDEKLLSAVVKATGLKSRSKAVQKVLEDYVRRRAIDELRNSAGKLGIDDMQEEQRAADRQRHGLLEDQREA
ncbi:MAG: type II toxin-antitoxin system VapB family antitoxin [Chloroflexi bacterium]|nr:type II toxin-antitoxin system VapB family antitoxin [Chloroflexota bacterium]